MGLKDILSKLTKPREKTEEEKRIEREEADRRKLEADEIRRQTHAARMKGAKQIGEQRAKEPVRSSGIGGIVKGAANNFFTTPKTNPFASDTGNGGDPFGVNRGKNKTGRGQGGFEGGSGLFGPSPFSSRAQPQEKKKHKKSKGKDITIHVR